MSDDNSDLHRRVRDLLNESGYPFQQRVEGEAAGFSGSVGPGSVSWQVLATEYPWQEKHRGPVEGFVDIIFESEAFSRLLVTEVKSVPEDLVYVFPLIASKSVPSERCKYLRVDENGAIAWHESPFIPPTPQSEYCVVETRRSRGRRSERGLRHTVIEGLARDLVVATESIGSDLSGLSEAGRRGPAPAFLFPTVVTNAKLVTCRYERSEISLEAGRIDDLAAATEEAPWIRFQKSFAAGEIGSAMVSLRDIYRDAVRTVFVVQARSFSEFLDNFEAQAGFVVPSR